MCMERLGQWFARQVDEGRLRKVKASRHGPGLSYLFFTDDILLLSKANTEQLACIKKGLDYFCKCSGQRVNYNKSSIFCSANASEHVAVSLSSQLGIPMITNMGKYLGHYIAQSGNNRVRHKELL